MALANAKPGTLSFGSSGIGAAAHLTTALLMLTMGIDPVGNSPAEFAISLDDEVAKWAKVIRAANVKIE